MSGHAPASQADGHAEQERHTLHHAIATVRDALCDGIEAHVVERSALEALEVVLEALDAYEKEQR